MKIEFYDTKPYDKIWFEKMIEEYGFEVKFFEHKLNEDTAILSSGFDVVCIFVNDTANEQVLNILAENGVKLIALRCAGYNNVDLKAIQDKIQEIADFKSSEEYKIKEETRHWREPLGISVNQLEKVTFKATAYSSLPEENGGYTVTCNGEPLKGNIVANNSIPQFTPILLGDELYRVADRGSSRFNKTNRLDLLIERNYGESIQDYRKRVSDYGVKYIEGYIMYQ